MPSCTPPPPAPDRVHREVALTTIGPGRLARAWFAAVGTAACALAGLVTVVAATSEQLVALVPAAILVMGGVIFARMTRLCVRFGEGEVLVRNYLRTWRFPTSEIVGFHVGAPSLGGTGTAAVVTELRGGRRVSLDATAQMRPLGTSRVQALASDLTECLTKAAP